MHSTVINVVALSPAANTYYFFFVDYSLLLYVYNDTQMGMEFSPLGILKTN